MTITKSRLRTLLAALVAAAVGCFALGVPASAREGTQRAARFRLVGFTGRGQLVFNDITADRVYLTNRDGSGLRLLRKHAKATKVVGRLVEYTRNGHPTIEHDYLDVQTGVSRPVPSTWTWLGVRGGLSLRAEPAAAHLIYLPVKGAARDLGALSALPHRPSELRVTVSPHGVLLVSGPTYDHPHRAVTSEYFPTPTAGAHAPLRLHGHAFRNGLDCTSLTATAISCRDILGYPHHQVIGLDPAGHAKPVVREVGSRLGQTLFAPADLHTFAYTTFGRFTDLGQSCPCTLHFSNGATIGALDSARLFAPATGHSLYFVRHSSGPLAGIYRTRFGSTSATRIVGPNLP